jgi:citrate lyase beta subunit
MHPRRALLYMPGDDIRKIQKATTLEVDCICMDLEDGVAANRKHEARSTVAQALQSQNFGQSERLARINAIGSGLEHDDLESLLPYRPDGIVVPKVEQAEQLLWVSAQIRQAELNYSWPEGQIVLIAVVETALGILNLREIASCDPRLQALIFGAEDLIASLGGVRTISGTEVFHARSSMVLHAAAFGLQAIDMVYVDFQDQDGLRREALNGVQMGFSGKQIIHPNQVKPVQEAFTPSQAEIVQAERIIQAFEAHKSMGLGAFALDGKMVDMPVVKAAQRVLDRAKSVGR